MGPGAEEEAATGAASEYMRCTCCLQQLVLAVMLVLWQQPGRCKTESTGKDGSQRVRERPHTEAHRTAAVRSRHTEAL
jgi:hypothetical protein